jgi:uncharacterized membrane protein
MKPLVVTIAVAGALLAQVSPPAPPTPAPAVPSTLVQFLQLTPDQVRLITQKNNEFNRFVAEKNRRAAQVRSELAVELRKPTLDPMALGLRQMELELIRREIVAAEDSLRAELRRALSAEQRSRLEALEKAMELVPLYHQAGAVRLVPPMPASRPVTAILVPPGPAEGEPIEDPNQ